MIYGIDVSSYQSATYSTTGYSFVFVKATEGASYTNPRCAAQVSRARAAKLHVGHYHFLRPGSVKQQAEYFVAKAPDQAGDSFWIDWEDAGVSNANKDAMIREVKRLRPNARVGLYCNVNFWTTKDKTSYAGDALWIARYGGSAGKPGISAKWLIHQYSETPIDKNVAQFASKAEMIAWAKGEPTGPVALTDADAKKVWTTDGVIAAPDPDNSNTHWTAGTYLRETYLALLNASAELREGTLDVGEVPESYAPENAAQEALRGLDRVDVDLRTD